MRIDELFVQNRIKTLYVCRHLINTNEIVEWAKEQGFLYIVPETQLHVTIAYSKEKVDWSGLKPLQNTITIKGGMRKIEKLGDAVVSRFDNDDLHERWEELVEHGCSWDYPSYKQHMTITFKADGLNIRKIVPFTSDLTFGPEQFTEINEDFKKTFKEIKINESVNESMKLGDGTLDPEHAYEIFKKSYEKETGVSWSYEKFMERARNWVFYGDENGFVAVRVQYSGPKKLVGVAGDVKSILKGLAELQAEGGPIWGAVSEPLARMAAKRNMICPSFYMGGGMLIRALISTIPASVFGGTVPEVNKDGSLSLNYEDTGKATKYLIGNKAYFAHAMKIPEIAEKLKTIPGVGMLLKMMGV